MPSSVLGAPDSRGREGIVAIRARLDWLPNPDDPHAEAKQASDKVVHSHVAGRTGKDLAPSEHRPGRFYQVQQRPRLPRPWRSLCIPA